MTDTKLTGQSPDLSDPENWEDGKAPADSGSVNFQLLPSPIDLSRLSEPFPADDIEWRVSRSGTGSRGIFCMVLAYITARAIQQRLDEVCGPERWQVTEPRIIAVNGNSAFAVGISILIDSDWITKWDVADPTNIEPAKGGFSGAMKRAGAQWGIGRYLYRLDETFAETAETKMEGSRDWNYAKLKTGEVFYWQTPTLPHWALPKEKEHEITLEELNEVKKAWRDKFADSESPADMLEGFTRFVKGQCGEFPVSDFKCWSRQSLKKCLEVIEQTTDGSGITGDVPFQ